MLIEGVAFWRFRSIECPLWVESGPFDLTGGSRMSAGWGRAAIIGSTPEPGEAARGGFTIPGTRYLIQAVALLRPQLAIVSLEPHGAWGSNLASARLFLYA